MADKLRIDTPLLRSLSARIQQTGQALSAADMSLARSIMDARRVAPKLTGITNALSSARGSLNRTTDQVGELARVIEAIAAMWEELERWIARLANIVPDDDDQGGKAETPEEKDDYIADYERDHPEHAQILNDFLNSDGADGLSEDDIRNIKYQVYSAKEPFRTMFIETLDRYIIQTINGTGGFYVDGTVNYTYPDCFADDPRGPYTVFFHECGHAIDDLADKSQESGYDTDTFRTYSPAMDREVTIREAIDYDVYHNRDNQHSVTSIAESYYESKGSRDAGRESAELSHVIDAFKSGDSSTLTNAELRLYNHVKNEFNRTTGSDAMYESVTDVYGGVSHNELRNNGYGHDNSYWDSRSESAQAHELWAEYFSYNMADNSENLAHLKEYFPESAKVMQAYAES